jgi:DNA ligase-1
LEQFLRRSNNPLSSTEPHRAMHVIHSDDVRSWYAQRGQLADFVRSIGRKRVDLEYLERVLGMPLHVALVVERLREEQQGQVSGDALNSIPFYSLCRGLFLPLSGLVPERVAELFGIQVDPPPPALAREELLRTFLQKSIGLSLVQKLACVLGDPFLGRKSTFRRDSLLRLLGSVHLSQRRELLDRLAVVGDVAVLYAEARPRLREEPGLTAAEVLETLRILPDARRTLQFDLLRSLLVRCGKLEAYFFAKLVLRKAGLGFDYQAPLLARTLAEHFKADETAVAHAIALTDIFHVTRVLADEGPDALRKIQLQPLVPVRPALAGGTTDEITRFPVWVERKYDGIRMMLHKSTDARGSVLAGGYTRNRNDWLEQVAGLDATIKLLPARNVIIDGELYGTVFDLEVVRPATVYEVYSALQGAAGQPRPVQMRYAAFDLIYLEGHDLTRLPLAERRQRLAMLLAPLANMPTPVPVSLAEGFQAENKDDINRLYHHFRAQGYEGIISKDLSGAYLLGTRDPSWMKRKPEVTLDLVLLAAVLAVTTKESAGRFGSYVIGARTADGGLQDVGDVAGVDRMRDAEIQAEILRDGLFTGRRIERPSSSGVRPGFELRPHIVVTVRFEGVVRHITSGELSLRDPKLVAIRSDKQPSEADSVQDIEAELLRQRVR